MRIYLFGGLAISWDDQPLPPIPGAATRSLFAYLVIRRDRPHSRDLLAGTFWPDRPDAVARRRLSQTLWQIRRTFHPHSILLTDRDTVQFNPYLSLRLDVEEFGKLVDWETGKPTYRIPNLSRLSQAVELYCGEFLAGYYDDWVLRERERLREVFLEVLERLMDGLKAQGDYEGALTYARRLATEDPWRESAHREVMRLCHLLRRDNEALQQYEVCRRVLVADLDAEPSASTMALASEIAVLIQAVEVPHLPVAARPSPLALLERPDQVPLVGRQAERAELARHLERAMAGNGGMMLLVGGTGVGKTRLMQEVARDAAWRGVRVGWGHSCELPSPPPYHPLVEVLCDVDLTYLPAVWRRELGRLIPELPPPPPALEPEHERGRLLEALARAFLALGQPHLVILEDLHWMDPASFEALRVLLPRLPASRLVVVGTLRPEELAEQPVARRALAALEATRIPQWLELAPLTATESESLIQRVLALAQPAPLFSQRVHVQTQGNPFFITETLRALVDEGLLYRNEGGDWSTPWDDVTADYAELPVPPSIVQSIEQRLGRLTPAVRDLLGIAAVVGCQVEYDLWLAAGGYDEATTLTAAEELVLRGLLVETDDVMVGYAFTHDTVRQVVYEGLSPARRRRYHRRVAAALEALHPDQAEALAWHYRLGQDWSRAVRYARQAGERAQAVYANQQALGHYRRADDWLARGLVALRPGSGQDWPADEAWSEDQVARWRADLAERQGQVQSLVGEYEAAGAAFARARQAWAGLGDRRGEARVLNQLSFLCFVQDDHAGASRYAELALDILPDPDPSSADLRATSLTYLGLSARTQGRYDDALPPLVQAQALFEEIGTDPYGLARCLNSLGLVHLERGDLASAEPCFARSLALRQEIGDRRGESWCWHNQGRAALARGDLTAAREKLATAQAIFAEIQHPDGLNACTRALAQLEQAEAADRCPEHYRRVVVRLPRADAPTGRPLRDDEYVTVSWTVDTPADRHVRGKVARRHRRLLRLLEEARAQGAAPAHKHLAEVLGVSQRTIERDMAALRREHPDIPPTRGKMPK